ncbi:NAD(P)-dependent oxidoreductase [Pseudomonas nabeulensis]|uniref:NAD(P)-dependent oxidoreductase n=1 Tax=Pseudomonas nabeulensis TaxID=2293833 RepID=A0A4Z0B105_9PSED|nr:NAD(P)-dependent oxidoreductase [Pseudomonas nabeulensis]TFY92293.1 NAD(P)-dependent oxidoreductase [Pseudomonas nabeulensis]
MHIAIFGANSQIAKDLTHSLATTQACKLSLFVRDKSKLDLSKLTARAQSKIEILEYSFFNEKAQYDAIINFVGVGDPALASKIGTSILDITYEYDKLALDYIQSNSTCRYIFLSSGAAYGGSFDTPVNSKSQTNFDLNNLQKTDWYGISKFYAETRHRARQDLSIIDIRVFNYFSGTQDLSTQYFITDAIRSIKEKSKLKTSPLNIYRDYITPTDFYSLILGALNSTNHLNLAVDCYTKSATDKFSILKHLHNLFDLQFVVENETSHINATGTKQYYFSENRIAKTLGYEPIFDSLEGLSFEIERSQLLK